MPHSHSLTLRTENDLPQAAARALLPHAGRAADPGHHRGMHVQSRRCGVCLHAEPRYALRPRATFAQEAKADHTVDGIITICDFTGSLPVRCVVCKMPPRSRVRTLLTPRAPADPAIACNGTLAWHFNVPDSALQQFALYNDVRYTSTSYKAGSMPQCSVHVLTTRKAETDLSFT
jgi:hypothetical protein